MQESNPASLLLSNLALGKCTKDTLQARKEALLDREQVRDQYL
jgi:hypothetical protein